jgi:hypothetical protein
MKRIIALVLALLPTSALAQATGSPQSLPLVVDLKKVPVGSWAEYGMKFGEIDMKSRWALVARDDKSATMEMSMNNPMAAQMPGGGKITLKMVMDPDPVNAPNPVKEMVMQIGDGDPMLAPAEAPRQKFQKPDARTLVGKEEIKVAAGTFKTSHYRDHTSVGTVDVWVSEDVAPLGLVKVLTTPEPQMAEGKKVEIPAAVMQLTATGTGAKPTITKPAKPFNAAGMMGGGPAPAPESRPAKSKKKAK